MAENRTEDKWLSVADISEKIGVPAETIRRYIRSHSVHMKVKKVHKRYVVHDECVTVFQQIRELYAEGKSVGEVEQALSDKGIPMTVTVQVDSHERVTVNVTDELKVIKDALAQQKEFNKLLFDKLEEQRVYIVEQQAYIDDKLELRDQKLMESIRTLQEEKKVLLELAATKEQEKKKGKRKGFFSRLFS